MTTDNHPSSDFSPGEIDADFDAAAFDLTWESVGPGIRQAVQEKRRRRRSGFYLLLGTTVVTLLLVVTRHLGVTELGAFPVGVVDRVSADEVTKEVLFNSEDECIQRAEKIAKGEHHSPLSTGKGAILPSLGATAATRTTEAGGNFVITSALPTPIPSVLPRVSSSTEGLLSTDQLSSFEAVRGTEKRSDPLKTIPQLSTLAPGPVSPAETDTARNVSVLPPTEGAAWFVSVAMGAAYTSQVPATSTTGTDKPLIGTINELRIGRDLSRRWSVVLTGTRQTQRWRNNATLNLLSQVYQPGTIDTIFRILPTGDEIYLYTDSVASVQQVKFQHFNEAVTWQVGTLVGFRMIKQRWRVSWWSGPQLRLSTRRSGQQLSANGIPEGLPLAPEYRVQQAVAWRNELTLDY
ncbi:MAG: hypothetical protein AAGJ82_08340, partial [Bacteroidota bacterium]